MFFEENHTILPDIIMAEKLLSEIRKLSRQYLLLEELYYYQDKISYYITLLNNKPYGQRVLPELKSWRLAFVCSIERLQNIVL